MKDPDAVVANVLKRRYHGGIDHANQSREVADEVRAELAKAGYALVSKSLLERAIDDLEALSPESGDESDTLMQNLRAAARNDPSQGAN